MFGWLKRRIQIKAIAAMEHDFARFLNVLEGCSPIERAQQHLIACAVRLFIRSEAQLGKQWAQRVEAILQKGVVAVENISAPFVLHKFINDFRKRDDLFTAGFMVWLLTIRCYANPELRRLGQRLWSYYAVPEAMRVDALYELRDGGFLLAIADGEILLEAQSIPIGMETQ